DQPLEQQAPSAIDRVSSFCFNRWPDRHDAPVIDEDVDGFVPERADVTDARAHDGCSLTSVGCRSSSYRVTPDSHFSGETVTLWTPTVLLPVALWGAVNATTRMSTRQ